MLLSCQVAEIGKTSPEVLCRLKEKGLDEVLLNNGACTRRSRKPQLQRKKLEIDEELDYDRDMETADEIEKKSWADFEKAYTTSPPPNTTAPALEAALAFNPSAEDTAGFFKQPRAKKPAENSKQ